MSLSAGGAQSRAGGGFPKTDILAAWRFTLGGQFARVPAAFPRPDGGASTRKRNKLSALSAEFNT